MIAHAHYDRRQLEDFLNDDSGTSSGRIAAHLENCLSCQEVLESLAQSNFDWRATADLLSDEHDDINKHQSDDIYASELTARLLERSQQSNSMGRFGRYEIIRFIGRGGMGIVMEGIDSALDRRCAIKVLAPELASSAAARRRFSREAKSAAAVVHAHVVPIQTVDEFKGIPFLVMPVVDGQSLQRRVDEHGPLSVIETVRIASQVAAGLAAAHAQGLVHRDIKPANILLENGVERVQLTDFGLARASDDANMTRSGVIAGTPQYMSPEQAHGDDIDYRSDLFSLGCTMYFMLTGRSPFRAETTMGVLNRIINDLPRPLHSINPDVPLWLSAIVMRLLEKKREHRFQTAEETSQLLASWLAHLQSPAGVRAPKCDELQKYYQEQRLLSGKGGSNAVARWAAGIALGGFALWLGTMVVLETNKGTLRIDSSSDSNIPIRIMQDGESVEQLTVSKEGTTTRLRAGQYTIELGDGVSGYEIANDQVTLLRGKEWIAKVQLTQDRQGAGKERLLPNERYDRIPIAGPTTSEGEIRAIEPPSDAELVAALKDVLNKRSEDTSWMPVDAQNVRVVKEKIVDFIDPIRIMPLLGETQLHHAHYKCTMYFSNNSKNKNPAGKSPEAERIEVIYIDHNHMHVMRSNALSLNYDPSSTAATNDAQNNPTQIDSNIVRSNVEDARAISGNLASFIIRGAIEDNLDILCLTGATPQSVEPLGFPFTVDNLSRETHFELISVSGDVLDAYIKLECDRADVLFWENFKGKNVSIRITSEDASEAVSGKFIKKVIYLSDGVGNTSPPEIRSLSTLKVEAGVDVLAEADRLGHPVLSMRILVSHSPRTTSIFNIARATLGRLSAEITMLSNEMERLSADNDGEQQRRLQVQRELDNKRALMQRIVDFVKRMTSAPGETQPALIWKSDRIVCLSDKFANELRMNNDQILAVNDLLSDAWKEYKELERTHTRGGRNRDGSLEVEAYVFPNLRADLVKKFDRKLGQIVSAENRQLILSTVLNLRGHRSYEGKYEKSEDAYPAVFGWSNEDYPIRMNVSASGPQLNWSLTVGKQTVTGSGLALPPELLHYTLVENQPLSH